MSPVQIGQKAGYVTEPARILCRNEKSCFCQLLTPCRPTRASSFTLLSETSRLTTAGLLSVSKTNFSLSECASYAARAHLPRLFFSQDTYPRTVIATLSRKLKALCSVKDRYLTQYVYSQAAQYACYYLDLFLISLRYRVQITPVATTLPTQYTFLLHSKYESVSTSGFFWTSTQLCVRTISFVL